MKTQRTFASLCLALSCCALVAATNVSVGDQPGVIRLTNGQQTFDPPAPVPPAGDGNSAAVQPPQQTAPAPQPDYSVPPQGQSVDGFPSMVAPSMGMSQGGPAFMQPPTDYTPYFQQSAGVTEAPVIGRRPQENPLFGPTLMFESNIGEGLGFGESYHRANARVPYHVVPGNTVLMADLSASVSDNNRNLYNFGAVWRNYDATRNRIFGWNAFWDMDDGRGNEQWNRIGVGMESLGRYVDFRLNGYMVQGQDSVLLADQLLGPLVQSGNNVTRVRNETRDNAYSGVDVEMGGPVPILGRRGINAYLGGYWLNNDTGYSTGGMSSRIQALITESATVDFTLTNDKTFGTNSWVSVSYSFPNYGERSILQPKSVRDRLADPVHRNNRVHSNIDVVNRAEAIINNKTGAAWNIVYVDPNATLAGEGTFERPYSSLRLADLNNSALIDVIQVQPRTDATNTNLTVPGGMDLFECQALVTATQNYTLYTEGGEDFFLPRAAQFLADAPTNRPWISNPTMAAGGYVVGVTNENTIFGMQIDGRNTGGTAFGTGITNTGGQPFEDINVVGNRFGNYTAAVDLDGGSGRLVFDNNVLQGVVDTSVNGILLTTSGQPNIELLIRNNQINNSFYADQSGFTAGPGPALNTMVGMMADSGIEVTAPANSHIHADSPNGIGASGPTGIIGNVVQNSGDGIVLTAMAGGRIDASIDDNESFNNFRNGLIARADGGVFNIPSMRNNMFGGEDLNANGVLDVSEDVNGDGILDLGEDLDGDNILDVTEDVNLNGILDNGEDRNGNGVLDLGEDTDGDGLLNPGEDLDRDGVLRPAEDQNGDGLLAAGNGIHGAFLHYLNGGTMTAVTEDFNDDTNFNGIQDGNEVLGLNGIFDVFDGTLSSLEDVNGNGLLDQGIVSNRMHGNGVAGLCIVGEDDSTGAFTVGGPTPALGNEFYQNFVTGIGVDVGDQATLSIDTMSNVIGRSARQETFVTTVSGTLALTGNTFTADHTLSNTSPIVAGQPVPFVTSFVWNLNRGAGIQGWEIDTEQQFIPNFNQNGVFTNYTINNAGFQFQAQNQTDLATNLQTVNGLDFNNRAILPNPGFLFPFSSYVTDLDRDIDADQQLALTFGNFGPSQANSPFVWRLDTDRRISNNNSLFPDDQVNANLLAGTSATMTFEGNFEGTGVTSTRTIPGTLLQDPNDPQGVLLGISALVVSGGLEPDPAHTGHGINVVATGDSRITNFTSTNDRVQLNKGDGIAIAAHNSAQVDSYTVQGALIDRNSGRGLNIEAHDAAVINASKTIGGFDLVTQGQNLISNVSFPQGNRITGNASDGVRVLAGNGGTVNGNLINNQIDFNAGNGVNLIVDNGGTLNFGNPPLPNNQVISRNTIQNNGGAGIRLGSTVTPGGPVGMIDADIQSNVISSNANGGIISSLSGNNTTGGQGNWIDLKVGGTKFEANTIDANGFAGIGFSIAGTGRGDISITNASVTNTFDVPGGTADGDGILLTRADSSLLTATIENVTATGNARDGLQAVVSGSDKNAADQPMTGTVNSITWNQNNFSRNGGDGASFAVSGAAQLFADGENNILDNNTVHGVQISTSGTATVGDATVGLPPGRRVVMNGTTSSNNGGDGFSINAADDSRVLLEITSNRTAPAAVGAHDGLNTNGDTNISGNGSDGVHVTTTGGTSDILVDSGTGTTTINGNGTNGGGNGVRWDTSGTADATVRITDTIISNSIAGASEDVNGNGILDAGEDANNNEDIDVVDGDGVQFNVTGQATSTLIVGGVGDGNMIRGNADDGIAITATGSGTNISRPIVTIVENTIGGVNNGAPTGNVGDGVSLNITGGTNAGLSPTQVDTDLTGGLFGLPNGVTESGPIVQFTMTDNVVSNNSRRGVNLLLNGSAGERNREFGAALFDPVRITMTGNNIGSNGTEGVFFRGDSDMNQSRYTFLPNFPFPNPPFNPANQRPGTFANYSPLQPEFQADNIGSVNANTAFGANAPDGELGYLNLRTVQNTLLTFTGNTVQNNGAGTVTGEGLVLSVGTGAYLAADVQANVFGGNAEEDVRTESFLSFGNTFDSVDDMGATNFDVVYHDDTAQLDMRFVNNSGDQISVTSVGATYTNRDGLKENALGFTPTNLVGVTERDAGLFQIDNGGNLDNPNNTFINFGITQDIDAAFSGGLFNLRAGADALFPNIGFAPFLP